MRRGLVDVTPIRTAICSACQKLRPRSEECSCGIIEPRLMTTEYAAKYLGVSAWTVRQYHHRGLLPVALRGKSLCFERRDLDALVDKLKANGGVSANIRRVK